MSHELAVKAKKKTTMLQTFAPLFQNETHCQEKCGRSQKNIDITFRRATLLLLSLENAAGFSPGKKKALSSTKTPAACNL
jgi:hypothetical protein